MTIKDVEILLNGTMELMKELPLEKVEKYYRQSRKHLDRPIPDDEAIEYNSARCEEMLRFIRNSLILFDPEKLQRFYKKIKDEVHSTY